MPSQLYSFAEKWNFTSAPSIAYAKAMFSNKAATQEDVEKANELINLKNQVKWLQEENTQLKAQNAAANTAIKTAAARQTPNPPAPAKPALAKIQNIGIDAATARNAIIFSEIIGLPVSKRRAKKWR